MATNRPVTRQRRCLVGQDVADVDALDLGVADRPRRPCCSTGTRSWGWPKARSCMIFDARSSSRRWMSVTLSANLVRKIASSTAESPPPTTAMSWSRKKKPSQVAHVDTPWPSSALLVRQPEHQRLRAGGDDHACGPVGGLGGVGVADPDAERAGARSRPCVDLHGLELGAEAGGLLPEVEHQLGAHDPLGEAGEVLDVGGQHQLAAGLVAGRRRLALDHERGEVGPGGVDGGGQARRARADDDDVADVVVDGHQVLLVSVLRRQPAVRPAGVPGGHASACFGTASTRARARPAQHGADDHVGGPDVVLTEDRVGQVVVDNPDGGMITSTKRRGTEDGGEGSEDDASGDRRRRARSPCRGRCRRP